MIANNCVGAAMLNYKKQKCRPGKYNKYDAVRVAKAGNRSNY